MRQSLCFPSSYECQRVSFKPLESLKKCMIYVYRAAIVWDRHALVVAALCQEISMSSYKFFLHPTEIVVAHLIVTELNLLQSAIGPSQRSCCFFLPFFKSQLPWHHASKVCFRSNAGGRPVESHICSCTTHARVQVHSAQVTDLQLTKIWSG